MMPNLSLYLFRMRSTSEVEQVASLQEAMSGQAVSRRQLDIFEGYPVFVR